jgi:cyanophycinase
MDAIAGTPIPGIIRARFAAGATIGGASAGAAAMSRTMIADETAPDGSSPAGPGATAGGLGLWPEAIVSPHFTERHRLNPLIAIVKGHPPLIGVGIDEGTAVFLSHDGCDVLGSGTVTIVDADGARARTLRSGMRCPGR